MYFHFQQVCGTADTQAFFTFLRWPYEFGLRVCPYYVVLIHRVSKLQGMSAMFNTSVINLIPRSPDGDVDVPDPNL